MSDVLERAPADEAVLALAQRIINETGHVFNTVPTICRALLSEHAARVALEAELDTANAALKSMGRDMAAQADELAALRKAAEALMEVVHGSWFADDGTDSDDEHTAVKNMRAALSGPGVEEGT